MIYIKDGESYSVTGLGTATDSKIVISAEYEGKPVTDVGQQAFSDCKNITSVTIPDSVTIVRTGAFANCTALKEVKLSSKLEEIWQRVFYNCTVLENLTLPDSLLSVGNASFYDANNGKLPKFKYTEQGGMQYVGTASNPYYALVGMVRTGLYIAADINKDTKVIADGAFDENWETLQAVYFPQELTGINVPRSVFRQLLNGGKFALNNGCCLGSMPEAGNTQSNHPNVAYIKGATANFPEGTKIISADGLKGFVSQTEIVVPDGVDSLGEYAFMSFKSLERITLPASLTILPRYIFNGCSALTDITYKGTKAQWNAIKKSSRWNANTAEYTVHCADGDISK